MKRLLIATCKLLPSSASIIKYWLLATLLIGMAALGLKATGDGPGTFWGMPLRGWDEDGRVLQQVYREMLFHVWTFITLPYVCFFVTRPLVRSFRRDFVQFLRYSHSSRIFMESVRVAVVVTVVLVTSLPFALGVTWGMFHLGLSLDEGMHLMESCAGTTLFLTTLIYLLAVLGAPAEINAALTLVTPFFMSGFQAYLEIHRNLLVVHWLPPGLPYTGITRSWMAGSCFNSNVLVGAALALGVIAFRIVAVARTRWLLEGEKYSG